MVRAVAHFAAGQYVEATSCARKSVLESPNIVTGYRMLVVSCALSGDIEEARAALKVVQRLQPDISLEWLTEHSRFTRETDRQEIVRGFRLAGLR